MRKLNASRVTRAAMQRLDVARRQAELRTKSAIFFEK